jgi:hypothetical protein
MNRRIVAVLACSISIAAAAQVSAQNVRQPQAIASSHVLSQISTFSYREGPKSDLVFRGTPIAANALGRGEVEYEDGNARIGVKVDDLPAPGSLGPYTTYVLWALTPDGRAGNVGSIATNNDLSLRRAIAVRDYLIAQRVPASSIDVAGLGASRPTADNATAERRARNRRVEIVVSGGPLEAGGARAPQ